MDGCDALQCRLDTLLAQQFAECIENDAIADAEEEMERSGNDALRWDGQKRLMCAIDGMLVCRSAVARGGEEVLVRNDADGARVSSRWSHEAKDSIDEWPVTIEEGTFGVNEMLQYCPDVRKGS